MLLTVIAYAMIIVFMYVIMTKKLSPFTSLVMIPLLFAIIAMVAGVAKKGTIGDFVLKGLTTTANTGIMLLFAILYFSIMLDAGLFDPITARMIKIDKRRPDESADGNRNCCDGRFTRTGTHDHNFDLCS
ncbi:hypothetical protein PY97_05205, partial [Lacticaseibacillus rhamnosus]